MFANVHIPILKAVESCLNVLMTLQTSPSTALWETYREQEYIHFGAKIDGFLAFIVRMKGVLTFVMMYLTHLSTLKKCV